MEIFSETIEIALSWQTVRIVGSFFFKKKSLVVSCIPCKGRKISLLLRLISSLFRKKIDYLSSQEMCKTLVFTTCIHTLSCSETCLSRQMLNFNSFEFI